MNKTLLAVLLMVILSLQAVWSMAVCAEVDDAERRLAVEIAADEGELLEMAQWDFSQRWVVSDKAKMAVKIHGDSLLSEYVNGRRIWYELRNDSLFFKGEEDRLTTIVADSTAMIGFYPVRPGYGCNAGFTASGTVGGRRFAVRETGVIVGTTAPTPRRLILAAGDTVNHAIINRETRSYTATFDGDSTHLPQPCSVVTYRWFDTDDMPPSLPVAYQQSVYLSDATNNSPATTSSLFIRDRLDSELTHRQPKETAENHQLDYALLSAELQRSTVNVDGRDLGVNINMSASGLQLNIDVVDSAGRTYLHAEYETVDTEQAYQLDCRDLRPGEYIVVISLEVKEVSPAKLYIKIR